MTDESDRSTGAPFPMPDDRLRDANEQLTLTAIEAQACAEELSRRYQEQNHVLIKKQRELRGGGVPTDVDGTAGTETPGRGAARLSRANAGLRTDKDRARTPPYGDGRSVMVH